MRATWNKIHVLLLIVGTVCSAHASGQDGKIQLHFTEKLLASLPAQVAQAIGPDGEVYYNNVSSDMTRIAYKVLIGGGDWYVSSGWATLTGEYESLVVDGVAGAKYKRIGNVYFSPDSRRIAYPATKADSKSEVVVVDSKEGEPFDEIVLLSLAFSPDSAHVAYLGRRGQDIHAVVDGVAGNPYHISKPRGSLGNISFSPDNQRLAFGILWPGNAFAVIDGVKGQTYKSLGSVVCFSPDSQRTAYIASKDSTDFLVVDGVETSEYPSIAIPVFSPDGIRMGFLVDKWGRAFAVVDGVEGKAFYYVRDLIFSPDSKRVAYCAYPEDGKVLAVVDGIEGEVFDDVRGLRFSPDSRHVTYVAKRGKKWVGIVDGSVIDKYEDMCVPIFSPDSTHVLYFATKNPKKNHQAQFVLVVDGVETEFQGTYNMSGGEGCLGLEKCAFDTPTSFRFVYYRGRDVIVVTGEIENSSL